MEHPSPTHNARVAGISDEGGTAEHSTRAPSSFREPPPPRKLPDHESVSTEPDPYCLNGYSTIRRDRGFVIWIRSAREQTSGFVARATRGDIDFDSTIGRAQVFPSEKAAQNVLSYLRRAFQHRLAGCTVQILPITTTVVSLVTVFPMAIGNESITATKGA